MESIRNETNASGKGLIMSVLCKLVSLACNAHEGNPSNCGPLTGSKSIQKFVWRAVEGKIRHTVAMKKYVSTCTLDMPSLMTVTDNINWMREMGI
eukprot:3626952-Ditylum_brightwellii.AAC.1